LRAQPIIVSTSDQATPNDPLVLLGVALTMLLVGVLATWIPALRVLHVDPTNVLRDQ
jgi:ABC-type lipoprotein release transport system permease subunit